MNNGLDPRLLSLLASRDQNGMINLFMSQGSNPANAAHLADLCLSGLPASNLRASPPTPFGGTLQGPGTVYGTSPLGFGQGLVGHGLGGPLGGLSAQHSPPAAAPSVGASAPNPFGTSVGRLLLLQV